MYKILSLLELFDQIFLFFTHVMTDILGIFLLILAYPC